MQSWLDSDVRVPQQQADDQQQQADDQQQQADDQQQKADDQQQVDELKGGLHDSKWSKKEYKPDPNKPTYAQFIQNQQARAKLLRLE